MYDIAEEKKKKRKKRKEKKNKPQSLPYALQDSRLIVVRNKKYLLIWKLMLYSS